MKNVIVRLSEPEDGFMTSREPLTTMQAVLKMPDDPVSEMKAVVSEEGVKNHIQREYLTLFNMVANLPAKRSVRR